MSTPVSQFTAFSRLLHWVMAVLILSMLCIGVAMITSLKYYHLLIAIHRPVGMLVFFLVIIRFINRLLNPPPPLPATVARWERFVATASEFTMYGLMFALPLVGWGMLSAARYPIVLYGPVHLPFILPQSPMLFAVLRETHTVLAYLFFTLFIAHFGAVLFHTLVTRDSMLKRMLPWTVTARS